MLKYNKKTIIILAIISQIILFFADYITLYFSMNIVKNINYKGIQCPIDNKFRSLPDIIHDNFNFKNIYLLISDYGVSLFLILFYFCTVIKYKENIIYSLKFFIIINIFITFLIFIRIISFSVTILPPTTKECKKSSTIITFNPFKLLKDELGNAHCTDYMFSGHTLILISYLYAILLTPISIGTIFNNKIFKIILTIISIIILFCISASRLHYTSDIVISIAITSLLFYIVNNNFIKKIINV